MMKTGLVHIYTGDGKGKTTAAVGMAVRAMSRGFRTIFAQFFKERDPGGELGLLEKMGIETLVFDKVKSPYFNPAIDKDLLRDEVKAALSLLSKTLREAPPEVLILDEFICLVSQGVLTEEEALSFLSSRPDEVEVVLTGHGATSGLIHLADYVTYMKRIKHPYEKCISARQGIEY